MVISIGQISGLLPVGQWQGGQRIHRGLRVVTAWLACACVMAAFFPLTIEAQVPGISTADAGPIQITADELISQIKNNYAEFIGNVEAVQGDFEIRSDRLRIHYRRDADQPAADPTRGDAIEKIVAIGRVRIKSGNREARTELAEYLVDEGLLLLKGQNSTVTEGSNSIRGSVITLNRLDGKISVTGGPSERVRAVFHSTGKTSSGGSPDAADKGAAATPKP